MICESRVGEPTVTYGQMNMIFRLRNLWREMSTWIRAYLISKFAGIGNTEDVFNRLYRIPMEFGSIVQLIFGAQAAEQYVQQLSQQLVLTREIIDAQMAGNTDLVNQKVMQLYQNAESRVDMIASINPFWDRTVIRSVLITYLQYTLDEITTLLTGEYERNIDIYDRLLHHSDFIGDYFAQGLFHYLYLNPQANRKNSF